MEPHRDEDRLAEDLRALKPTPRPEFAAKLDERAAAGFPRRSRVRSSVPGLADRLRGLSVRRALIPVGGVAFALIAVATGFVLSNQSSSVPERSLFPAGAESGEVAPSSSGGEYRTGRKNLLEASPQAQPLQPIETASSAAQDVGPLSGNTNGSFNSSRRAVERSAQIVLAAEPGDVADDVARVFETVRAHNGIVMSSSTSQGAPGEAGARFELLIPSAKLGDALAELSEIDEVRSRHEATADITAPTVNVGELLQDSKARIDSLLGQLEGSETESEREAVEAELRGERRHRARLRAQLQHLRKRADLSRVSLRIETGGRDESSGGGAWGVDDAIGDAGKILSAAAAVTLIALAVIAPIALIALLAWLTHRIWVRRERRRALG